MAALNPPKYEAFAQSLAAGKTQIEAYSDAGYKIYKTAAQAASRLAADPRIRERINEILSERGQDTAEARQKAVEKAGLTEDYIVERLKYTLERALRGNPIIVGGKATGTYDGRINYGAVTRCLDIAARMKGLYINKVEVGAPGEFDRMSDDELEVQAQALAQRLGIAPPPKANGLARKPH